MSNETKALTGAVAAPAFTCVSMSTYLLSPLGLCVLGEVGSFYYISHDRQAFPCLQLSGEGQQTRVFDSLI